MNIKRPRNLAFLCILSFIGGGFNLLSNFFFYAFNEQIIELINNGTFNALYGEDLDMSFFIGINRNYFLLQILLFTASIIGVYFMWQLKSLGFNIYVTVQILLLILSEIYISGQPFPLIPILLSLVFILLYFKNLRDLGRI